MTANIPHHLIFKKSYLVLCTGFQYFPNCTRTTKLAFVFLVASNKCHHYHVWACFTFNTCLGLVFVTEGAKSSCSTLSRTSSALMVSFLVLTFSASLESYVCVMGNRVFSRLELALQVPCRLYQIIFVAPSHVAPYTCFPPIYLYIHSTTRRHPYIRILRLTRPCTHTCIYSTLHSRSQNSPAV